MLKIKVMPQSLSHVNTYVCPKLIISNRPRSSTQQSREISYEREESPEASGAGGAGGAGDAAGAAAAALSGGGAESLSIEDTNRLRAKLGLKPLEVHEKPEGQCPNS